MSVNDGTDVQLVELQRVLVEMADRTDAALADETRDRQFLAERLVTEIRHAADTINIIRLDRTATVGRSQSTVIGTLVADSVQFGGAR